MTKKKKKKNIHTFRQVLPTIKNFFKFQIKQYWQFQGVTTRSYYTLFHISYQTILTISESYYRTRVNTFSELLSNIPDKLRELQKYTLLQRSKNTDIFRVLLANDTTNFSLWKNTEIFREFLVANNTTLVHELEPKKIGIWLQRVDKIQKKIFGNLRISTFWETVMTCLNW